MRCNGFAGDGDAQGERRILVRRQRGAVELFEGSSSA
jgi:hypothetical protein